MATNGAINNDDQGAGELPGNAAMEIERTEEQKLFRMIYTNPSYTIKQNMLKALSTEQKTRYQAYLQGNESNHELCENTSIRRLGSPQ